MTAVEEVGAFGNVPLEIGALMDRRIMPVREILDLSPGSVVPMTRSPGEPIDICVAGRVIGYGEVVIIENTVGVRITGFIGENGE